MIASRTFTLVLVAINVAVFVLMVLKGVSPIRPDGGAVLRWGGEWGPLSLGPQPWRMLTSAFVHVGIIHLAANMWALWELGGVAETVFGRANFLLLYFFSALGGALASLWWHPLVLGAGASGAIFGVAGALIAAFALGKLPLPKRAMRTKLEILVLFAAVNLFFGARAAHVDNAAHVGGFLTGLLIGTFLTLWLAAESARPRRAAFAAIAVLLVVCGWSVRRANAYIPRLNAGVQALDSHNYDAAIGQLSAVVALKPRLAKAWCALGAAYLGKQQYPTAEAHLRHAVGLNPKYVDAYKKLGLLYLVTNRLPYAHTVLSKALTYAPGDLEAMGSMAMVLEASGRDEEALTTYRQVAAKLPQNAFVQSRIGVLQLKRGHPDEALAALEEALRIVPDNPDYLMELGNAYQEKGMKREAAAAFERAAELKAMAPKRAD